MKSNNPFVIATLAFLTFGVVVLIIFTWPNVPVEWKSYLCKPEDCTLQQWLSSISGWFGGLLAAAGAVIVYWQLREQRRQTEFLIGDGEPSVDVVSTATDELSAFFRVVNWNRRLIVVGSISFLPDPGVKPIFLHRLAADYDLDRDEGPDTFTESTRVKADGDLWNPPELPGWEDRSKPPAAAIFVLEFDKGVKSEAFGNDARQIITVSFGTFAPGNHMRRSTISVKAIRGNLFARTQKMHDENTVREA